jgi:hypothetical protein
MADKVLVGLKSPFGTLTTTAGWTGVISTVNKVQGHTLTDNFDKTDFKDGDGTIIGRAGFNPQHTLSLEVIFYDPSNPSLESAARSNTKLPAIFDIVTIAGSAITFIDGTWNYESGSYVANMGEGHKFSLQLWRGGAGASPAALT